MKIFSPLSTRCPPSLSLTSTDLAHVKLASPKIKSKIGRLFQALATALQARHRE
jgi:hypothetical protein